MQFQLGQVTTPQEILPKHLQQLFKQAVQKRSLQLIIGLALKILFLLVWVLILVVAAKVVSVNPILIGFVQFGE
jgi:hypothetical protein